MRLFTMLTLVALFVVIAGCGGSNDGDGGRIVLTMTDDPTGKIHQVNAELAERYESENPHVDIQFVSVPQNATERLGLYLQFLGARSDDVDVYQMDVIWPGILDGHLVDLSQEVGNDAANHFETIINNNTVDGRLVGIPFFADAGILYYRTDLLEKYGFDTPPESWQELENMAYVIQEGERKEGNSGFWGYVWQGKAYEGLTCNAIEWIASHDGGTVVQDDGTITINNPNAQQAIARAATWIDHISPPGITSYGEEEARNIFHTGQAAFMRNWPYAYSVMSGEDSAIVDKFNITRLPTGGGGHSAALGGWQLAVSRYSAHPEEAIRFAQWMTSPDVQKYRAIHASCLPTRPAIYEDEELAAEIPFIAEMKNVFLEAVARPSTVTGENYNEVSSITFRNIHRVLTDQQSADEAVLQIEEALKPLVNEPGGEQ